MLEGRQKCMHWPGSAAEGGWFCAAVAEAAVVVVQSGWKQKQRRKLNNPLNWDKWGEEFITENLCIPLDNIMWSNVIQASFCTVN